MTDGRRCAASPEPYEINAAHPIAGCLLVHGLTGSPAEMRPLAEYLGARGYHCVVPLLPGHGTTLEDLHCVTWQDWVRAAEKELARLQAQHATVCIVGFSLGTLIAAHLAALHPDLAAVALLSPALVVRNRLLPLAPILHAIIRTFPKGTSALQATDAEPYLWHYDRWSTHAAAEMLYLRRHVRRELASARVPVLIVQSTQDAVVAPDSG
ncbi:MAG: alpha/beta fold hydrolase, partial [Anaerolineae bacterium]